MQALSSKSQLCQQLRTQNESFYRNYRRLQKLSVGSKTHTQWTTLLVQLPARKGFPGGSDGKRICLQSRRPGFDRWVGKIPWRREWLLTPLFLSGESHAQRSLAGYSPWGPKELDTTQWLTLTNAQPKASAALAQCFHRCFTKQSALLLTTFAEKKVLLTNLPLLSWTRASQMAPLGHEDLWLNSFRNKGYL